MIGCQWIYYSSEKPEKHIKIKGKEDVKLLFSCIHYWDFWIYKQKSFSAVFEN